MSRERASALRGMLRRAALPMAVISSIAAAGASPAAAQPIAPDGRLPACQSGNAVRDCVLPAWPDSEEASLPSVFGAIEPGDGTWVADRAGDVAEGALDILAVGVVPIRITDPAAVRGTPSVLTRGTAKKAIKRGPAVLVRVVLDRPFDAIETDHSSIHVATDVDGSRSNNAPTGAGRADGPFAGSQEIYSVGYAASNQKTKLLASDLARGWYKAKDRFAADRPAAHVIDLMVSPEDMGDGLRVITFVDGDAGGYDSISVGPSSVPVDGRVGLVPECIEGTITAEPFTVGRLIENGQTLRDIEAPASWHGGARFALTDDEAQNLRSAIERLDEDRDGRITVASTVGLFEEGLVIRQRPGIDVALDGDQASLAMHLGLTKRGFTILRDLDLESTGDAATDALLERMTRSLAVVTPPFRSGKRSGSVAGPGPGSCTPALIAATILDDVADIADA